MYSFRNDYSELAHKEILDLMMKVAEEQNSGYGLDVHSENAKELIKKRIGVDADIHFLIGGTSCNKIIISHVLRPYEAVISVSTGHINVHETGAIEASGHKVISTPGIDGKINPEEIKRVCKTHCDEHMVVPKMVYISNSTELGTIYTLAELKTLHKLCRELDLYLFLDGARLGVALTAEGNDLSLEDIARMTDVFYIGGTKNGALLGEAVVIVNPKLRENFRHSIKQNAGMLAKGFVAGLQFEALFRGNLYFDLALHANQMAKRLKVGLRKLSVEMGADSPTNQQFITLKRDTVNTLKKDYDFEIWEDRGEMMTIRLVTSWATTAAAVDAFLVDLERILRE
jgi:threonine aldolase